MDGEKEVEVREELIEAKGDAQDKKPEGKPDVTPQPKEASAAEETAKAADPHAAIEQLLAAEKDPERRKLLEQVKQALAGSAAKAAETHADAEDTEKVGRKLAADRVARLKKLLEELKGLVAEVDDADAARAREGGDAFARIARALGIEDDKGEVPNLAQAITDVRKRLDNLERAPAAKAAIDGQEDLAGGGARAPGGSPWRGML